MPKTLSGRLANGQRVLARTEAAKLDPETTVRFEVAMDKAHLFEDGTYGANITPCGKMDFSH